MSKLVTGKQAADLLGLTLNTFCARVHRGDYKPEKIMYGKKLYDVEKIKAFQDKRKKQIQ